MKDMIEKLLSSCRFPDLGIIGLAVGFHIILYQLESLSPKHHAKLIGMTSSQQTISSENRQLWTIVYQDANG